MSWTVTHIAIDLANTGRPIYTDEFDQCGDVNTNPLANAITFHRVRNSFKGVQWRHVESVAREIRDGHRALWTEHSEESLVPILARSYELSGNVIAGQTAVIASRLERMLKGIAPHRWASGYNQG